MTYTWVNVTYGDNSGGFAFYKYGRIVFAGIFLVIAGHAANTTITLDAEIPDDCIPIATVRTSLTGMSGGTVIGSGKLIFNPDGTINIALESELSQGIYQTTVWIAVS